MKQRFSSLDVKVIAHELAESLVTLRLANVYDLSSKILLLKFAKPDNKKQLLIDSGFRCHLTEFSRTTAAAPSAFVARLRKFLKTRRLTGVAQIGTDRIIEFQFSDGQYRLYLEFFASGNIILTDGDLKILTLLRNVPEGEGQEPQRVGLLYNLDNRQNVGGIPALSKDRVISALKSTIDRAAKASSGGKQAKKKGGDDLRRGLATTITELPPILVDHAFRLTNFDSKLKPSEVLDNESLLDGLLKALEKARGIAEEVTSTAKSKGYIIAKRRPNTSTETQSTTNGDVDPSKDLLYDDFHPFLPKQFADEPQYTILPFDGFNKTVDEFFSSVEGQKLESRLNEREAAAKRKLDAARSDQAKRVEGLQEAQILNLRKAAAIEANVERVQEAMDAVNGLLQQGMDWVDINKLVEREQKLGNPVAEIIKLPMKLAENTITLSIGEEEEEDAEAADDFDYDTDSSVPDSEYPGTENGNQRLTEKRLEVDINLALTPWSNAREYYEQKRSAATKEQKTLQQSKVALKNAEHKIVESLKKGLKQEKAVLQPLRRQIWFEKFNWFISSDGYLVLAGKDPQQNEMLYKRHLRKGDVYVHADLQGASSVVIKNNPQTPDAPIPPSTLSQAGNYCVCSSTAWDSKAGMSAWWVNAEQVSKFDARGTLVAVGEFAVRGEKNFLPAAQLLLGFAIMFKISEKSKANHVKHRLYDSASTGKIAEPKETDATKKLDLNDDQSRPLEEGHQSDSEPEDEDDANEQQRSNPLQSNLPQESDAPDQNAQANANGLEAPTEDFSSLQVTDREPHSKQTDDTSTPNEDNETIESQAEGNDGKQQSSEPPSSRPDTPSTASPSQITQNKIQPPKRGQRGKAKKVAAKYKDQDDEDRALMEVITGAAAGRQKLEAEAAAKAQREADAAAAAERRRLATERARRETAQHEERRRRQLEQQQQQQQQQQQLAADGAAADDDDDDAQAEQLAAVEDLVGTPAPGDEILEAVAVCGPWAAVATRCKYRVKLQPGANKKGKAVREVVEKWKADAAKKSAVDEEARDTERMWPREVELIRALRPEEVVNVVPVGRLKVMMAGGGGGGDQKKGGGGGTGGGKGGGGRGGKKK